MAWAGRLTMAALAVWALGGDSAPGSRQQGLEPFATGVVKKEKFVRSFINLHHDMLFERPLDVFGSERAAYKELYDLAMKTDLQVRPLLKRLVLLDAGAKPRMAASD